jgi:hypothetical protein
MKETKPMTLPEVKGDVDLCYESDTATLYFHRRTRILHHQLRGFLHGKEFRQLLEAGLTELKKRGASKWLSDDRLNGPITAADEEWSKKNWTPRALRSGWKYWAVVFPEKVLGQMNMRRWIDAHAEKGLTTQGFADPEEARRWLEKF